MDDNFLLEVEVPKSITIIKEIGRGGFSKVYKIIYRDKIYAMKIVENNKIFENEFMNLNENNILNEISSPYIIKLNNTFFTKYHTMFLFNYFKGGNLTKFMKKLKKRNIILKENIIRSIIIKILKGIKYLHSNNIIHRDIKPDNILIDSYNNLKNIVISDFGLATKKENNINFQIYQKCGTIYYMAPEVIKGFDYDLNVDIWSLGIILLMFVNNYENPLRKFTKEEVKYELKNNWIPNISNLNCSELLKSLLSKIFVINPAERYSINQILYHPWILNNGSQNIPFTKSETMNIINTLFKSKQIIKFLVFMAFIKKQNKNNIYKKKFNTSIDKILKEKKNIKINSRKKENFKVKYKSILNSNKNSILYYNGTLPKRRFTNIESRKKFLEKYKKI